MIESTSGGYVNNIYFITQTSAHCSHIHGNIFIGSPRLLLKSEIEETLNRIKTHKSVRGIVVCNAMGKIVRNTFAEGKKEEGENIAKTIPPLAIKARNTIKDLDSSVKPKFP